MIDRAREQVRNPWVAAALGFVVGLIIGLPILGWGLWPVKWENAAAEDLRADAQADYLCMTIDSFLRTQNRAAAEARYLELGENRQEILSQLQPEQCGLTTGEVIQFQAAVIGAGQPLPEPIDTGAVEVTQALPTQALPGEVEPVETDGGGSRTLMIVGLCVVLLLVGGGLVYLLVFRNRRPGSIIPSFQKGDTARQPVQPEYVEGQDAPVAQYMTTYMAGDDMYDDSFSIDSPSGEFLGECGVGIAETIGVGDPKKVTAFEVWLFDKNDIQTITKVLMSDHVFNDPQVRQKLALKGEPVLIEHDKHILLETATLQLQARVVDLNYGQGALPEHSFFDRLTLELAVWPKPEA